MKKIKNYTSEVNANKTISQIESLLSDNGASGVLKEFETVNEYQLCKVKSITFQITVNDRPILIKLPCNVEKVYNFLLQRNKNFPLESSKKRIWQQSERTAWKNILEWLQINFSLLALNQIELMEIFLPYVWDSKSQNTYYGNIKEDNFLKLPSS